MNRTNELFQEQLTILNVGAPNFREDLKLQGQQVTQIKWQPPMDGDQELLELLEGRLALSIDGSELRVEHRS